MNIRYKRGKYNGHDGKKFYQNVYCRSRSILERVSHGIADNSRFVAIAAFPSVVAAFNIFFRVIPCAAGVAHEYGKQETGCGSARKKTDNARRTQNKSHSDGNDNGNNRGSNHFTKRCAGAEVYAGLVIGIGFSLHNSRDGTELSANLFDNAFRSSSDGTHRKSRKDKRQTRTDKQTAENDGIQKIDREVFNAQYRTDLFFVRCDKRKCGQSR